MMGAEYAVKTIFITTPLILLSQIPGVGAIPDLSWIGQIRDAGLVGALLVAVYALWRSRESMIVKIDLIIDKNSGIMLDKDKQILSMIEHVTAAQTAQVETNRELRKIIEDSVKAKVDLTTSINLLGGKLATLPCTMEDITQKRPR